MLELFWQPRCVLCKAKLFSPKQPLLCRYCHLTIRRLQGPACHRCLHPLEMNNGVPQLCGRCLKLGYFDRLYSFGAYEGALMTLIRRLKFGKNLNVAPVMGSLLASHVKRHLINNHYDCIIPVPLHRKSLRKRGFNHAQQLSRYIRNTLDVPCDLTGLVKHRYTQEQARLTIRQREKNLSGAFKTNRSYHGESCLLIDDVYTTGATAETCARELKAAGALKVDVLTLARTV